MAAVLGQGVDDEPDVAVGRCPTVRRRRRHGVIDRRVGLHPRVLHRRVESTARGAARRSGRRRSGAARLAAEAAQPSQPHQSVPRRGGSVDAVDDVHLLCGTGGRRSAGFGCATFRCPCLLGGQSAAQPRGPHLLGPRPAVAVLGSAHRLRDPHRSRRRCPHRTVGERSRPGGTRARGRLGEPVSASPPIPAVLGQVHATSSPNTLRSCSSSDSSHRG